MIKNALSRVLLAEDSEIVGARILGLLSTIPAIEVLGQAKTAKEGQLMCGALNPDILILDINFPDGSGIGILKELKSMQSHTRVIMLTNSSNEFYRNKCIELGAEFFLDKTKDFPKIVGLIRHITS